MPKRAMVLLGVLTLCAACQKFAEGRQLFRDLLTLRDQVAKQFHERVVDVNISTGGRVVICGGDGTLHRAVRDYDLAGAPLALLPLGSGDDFAKVCGIPRNLRGACEVAVRGAIREVDVAHANGIRYLGVAGLGFDSEV